MKLQKEIIQNLSQYITFDSIRNLMLVCKGWNTTISKYLITNNQSTRFKSALVQWFSTHKTMMHHVNDHIGFNENKTNIGEYKTCYKTDGIRNLFAIDKFGLWISCSTGLINNICIRSQFGDNKHRVLLSKTFGNVIYLRDETHFDSKTNIFSIKVNVNYNIHATLFIDFSNLCSVRWWIQENGRWPNHDVVIQTNDPEKFWCYQIELNGLPGWKTVSLLKPRKWPFVEPNYVWNFEKGKHYDTFWFVDNDRVLFRKKSNFVLLHHNGTTWSCEFEKLKKFRSIDTDNFYQSSFTHEIENGTKIANVAFYKCEFVKWHVLILPTEKDHPLKIIHIKKFFPMYSTQKYSDRFLYPSHFCPIEQRFLSVY